MGTKYFECGCTAEILRVEVDYFADSKASKDFSFSIYERPNNRFPLLQRIKHAIHILRFNRPHPDAIILNMDEAMKLMDFIKAEIDESRAILEREKEPEK